MNNTDNTDNTKENLLHELKNIQQKYDSLKATFEQGLKEKEKENLILEKLIKVSEDFIQFQGDAPDYNMILQIILEISGARYAALNIFDDNGLDFTTVALSGINENILEAIKLLGFVVINKHWKHDPLRAERTQKSSITRFESLGDLTGSVISKNAISILERSFGLGETFIVKISKESKVVGDFTLIYTKNETLNNSKLVDLYAHQTGMFLDRYKITNSLLKSEEKHRLLIENSHDIIYTLTPEGVFMFVSSVWTSLLGHQVTEVSGKSFQQFVHPDDLPGCLVFLQKVISTGQRQEGIEYRVKHLNGTWYWHTSSAVPLRDEAGKVIGFEGTARDITKRKQAEDLLEQTRRNYETFFNTIDEFLFVLDEQGNIIYTNSTVIDRLGYSGEELSGKSVLMVHPPERREEAGRIVGEMLSGVSEFCPVPIVTKSGVQIPVETRVSHGFWDGKPVIYGVTKDISKVRLSEEKFSKLFYVNPSACGLSDLEDHTYIEVNEAFYNLFGFDKSEVIGKTAIELGIFTPEEANLILQNADSSGKISNVAADLKARNGDIKKVLLSAENIFVQDKKYRYTVVHDITEIKLAEDALLKSSQKLEAIISASPDGIGMISIDGKLKLLSEKLITMYGYSIEQKEELLAKSIYDFIDPSNHKLLKENIGKLFRGEQKASITEYLAIKQDNSRFYLDVNSTILFDLHGKPESILFVERDITHRKLAEEEISLKNEELIRANSEKDKFFSIIAHDLRSPFNSFLGLTQIMAEELPSLTMTEIQNIAVNMRTSATNLFRLLENLLEWSRTQQGIIAVNREVIKFIQIVNESLAMVLEPAKLKRIDISYNIPDDLEVFADSNILQTVIRNLVSNAVKFTPKGGKVNILAKTSVDNTVEVSVFDSGIGMSPEMVANLFRLDVQTNRKGTEGEPSIGLGLVICKDFIERQGGKLWVESEEGKGSVFYFTIPYSAEHD